MSRSQFNYSSRRKESGLIFKEILLIKEKHPRFGVPRVTALLRKKGLIVNRKRVYRILTKTSLLVGRKRKRQRAYVPPQKPHPQAERINQVWSIDFISARLENGSAFRCFTGIDIHSRVSPLIFASTSMDEGLPVKVLENLRIRGVKPEAIVLDNGPEFTSREFIYWSQKNGVNLHFIDPGQPTQNGYIESFHSRFRDEFLNHRTFRNIAHARLAVENWRRYYNEERPHSSLNYATPKEFVENKEAMLVENPEVLVALKTG